MLPEQTTLTPVMRETLREMTPGMGAVRLVRRPGGFWTLDDEPLVDGRPTRWFASTRTVHALERRGFVRVVLSREGAPLYAEHTGKAVR